MLIYEVGDKVRLNPSLYRDLIWTIQEIVQDHMGTRFNTYEENGSIRGGYCVYAREIIGFV